MADAEYHLVIIQAHADYNRGDMVTDPEAIRNLLIDHPDWVAKIQVSNPN